MLRHCYVYPGRYPARAFFIPEAALNVRMALSRYKAPGVVMVCPQTGNTLKIH